MGEATGDELRAFDEIRQRTEALRDALGRVIVGQEATVESLLVAMLCRGHVLIVGVPGLAKTMLVRTLARAVGLAFKRIQFTPDLMPSDILGTELIQEDAETGQRHLKFVRGPVFAQLILADEINRTPPKTQAALLEAMAEHQVTVAGQTMPLDEPFLVVATQNPIEQEGTYPLPEAQLDRFMFMITIAYPSEVEEAEIIRRTTSTPPEPPSAVLTGEDVLRVQELVREAPVADHVIAYALRLVRATRIKEHTAESPKPRIVQDYLSWGAGPRASQYLILAAKARAVLEGSFHVTPEHVKSVAMPVLRHRIIVNFNAEADGVTSDDVVRALVEEIPVDGGSASARDADAVLS